MFKSEDSKNMRSHIYFLNFKYILYTSEENYQLEERPCWRECVSGFQSSETSASTVWSFFFQYFFDFHCIKNYVNKYSKHMDLLMPVRQLN